MTERGLESPYAERLKEWPDDPEQAARITTRVDCAAYFQLRDQALLAHATQVDPEGPWFSVPLDVHQRAWPTEDFSWSMPGRQRDPGGRSLRGSRRRRGE